MLASFVCGVLTEMVHYLHAKHVGVGVRWLCSPGALWESVRKMSWHASCQGAFSHCCLGWLSHCGLMLAWRVELVHLSWPSLEKKNCWTFPPKFWLERKELPPLNMSGDWFVAQRQRHLLNFIWRQYSFFFSFFLNKILSLKFLFWSFLVMWNATRH